jgi:hypothetical protein
MSGDLAREYDHASAARARGHAGLFHHVQDVCDRLRDRHADHKDYLTVPVDEIGSIVSLLTMVGGRIVYGDGPFAAYEETAR